MTIERKPIASGALAAVGYDPETGELEIEFRSGRAYRYTGVPASLHAWLLRTSNRPVFIAHHLAGRYGERSLPDPASPPEPSLEEALRCSLNRFSSDPASETRAARPANGSESTPEAGARAASLSPETATDA